jgi:hypothetical protein
VQTYAADPAPEDVTDLLRLTELEVHHLDLDCGYQIGDWLTSFARTRSPRPVSWLGAHHSRRADTDRRGRYCGCWRKRSTAVVSK